VLRVLRSSTAAIRRDEPLRPKQTRAHLPL
jgi:hypothetical protein